MTDNRKQPGAAIYLGKLVRSAFVSVPAGAVALGGAGFLLSHMVQMNGVSTPAFVPYFTAALGAFGGYIYAARIARVYRSNFVMGARRVVRMSAAVQADVQAQEMQMAAADSNDSKVLNAAVVRAGFPKGLSDLTMFASSQNGQLMLPGVLRDINGAKYGIQGSHAPRCVGASERVRDAARTAALQQSAAMAGAAALAELAAKGARDSTHSVTDLSDEPFAPDVNTNGVLMLDGTMLDVLGNAYGADK